jgi:hypothetical protein
MEIAIVVGIALAVAAGLLFGPIRGKKDRS